MFENIYVQMVLTVLILAAIAFLLGLLLAFFGKKFAVKKDPRIDRVAAHLPGANCAGCGFSGCAAYAKAIVEEGTSPSLCPVSKKEDTLRIAEIMGIEVSVPVRMKAQIRCSGTTLCAEEKYTYHGLADCRSAVKLGAGPKVCPYGCIGLGTCVSACSFGALSLKDGLARVAPDLCRGCGKCAEVCPQNLIELVPFDSAYRVACRSQDKGGELRLYCRSGCIGCGICVKNCPSGAISIRDHLAYIDTSLCTNCGICVEKCPRKIIRSDRDGTVVLPGSEAEVAG